MTVVQDRPATRRRRGWDERTPHSGFAGLPWWAAISLALGLTAAGALADIQRFDRLGFVFQAGYCFGCLLAVILVQRKGLFGPMVAPPLILATAVPGVVLLAGSLPTEAGTTATVLAVGTPLINGFPTMAITTVLALTVGGLRLLTQRPSSVPPRRGAVPGSGAAPGSGTTPRSGRPRLEAPDAGESGTGRPTSRRTPNRRPTATELDDQGPPTDPIGPPIRHPVTPASVAHRRRRG